MLRTSLPNSTSLPSHLLLMTAHTTVELTVRPSITDIINTSIITLTVQVIIMKKMGLTVVPTLHTNTTSTNTTINTSIMTVITIVLRIADTTVEATRLAVKATIADRAHLLSTSTATTISLISILQTELLTVLVSRMVTILPLKRSTTTSTKMNPPTKLLRTRSTAR